jgi:hypothetical protein
MTTYVCEKQISYEIINNAKFTNNSNYLFETVLSFLFIFT